MPSPRIVERWLAKQLPINGSTDTVDDPHQVVGEGPGAGLVNLNRHAVVYLRDAVRGDEARDQDVRVWDVHLASRRLAGRADLELPALLVVQDRAEQRGRVEARQTQPVDRPIPPD